MELITMHYEVEMAQRRATDEESDRWNLIDDDDDVVCKACLPSSPSPSSPSSSSPSPSSSSPPACSTPLLAWLIGRSGRALGVMSVMLLVYLLYLAISSDSASARSQSFGEAAPRKEAVNTTRAREVLTALCDAFDRHEVSGDSCDRLCYERKWDITDYYEGNKVVVILKDGGQSVVLKATRPFARDYEKVNPQMSEEAFTDKVLERLNEQLRLGWPSHYKRHLIETVWPSALRSPGARLSSADRDSLWALSQQPEFVTFRVLPLTRVTPKIIGTCGHMYESESLVAFRMKGYYMNLKGKILVHLMGTLKLFYEFLNEPLQWCDVRFENLGLSADYPKRFVVMDGDSVFTESRLNDKFAALPCATDADCRIGDCNARCTDKGVCGKRMNENLDVFCEKLVNKLFGAVWSKNNKYLAACHDTAKNTTTKLNELRLTWSWTLSDV